MANQGPQNVTALVACDEGRYGTRLSRLFQDLRLANSTDLHADKCDIYEHGRAGFLRRPYEEQYPIGFIY